MRKVILRGPYLHHTAAVTGDVRLIITLGIVLRYAGIDRLRRAYPGPESYCGWRSEVSAPNAGLPGPILRTGVG
jgi:hypothetical protein